MNIAQAWWLVLGYAQANEVPDKKQSGRGSGDMDDFLNAMSAGRPVKFTDFGS